MTAIFDGPAGDLDAKWLQGLRRRMFGDVWRWAGSNRKKDTNIGIAWHDVAPAVHTLLLDIGSRTQVSAKPPWSADEVAVRFHHRLVVMHPFVNGNGRHARVATDVLAVALGEKRFDWGVGAHLADKGPARDRYLSALRRADQEGDYSELLAFSRSPEAP